MKIHQYGRYIHHHSNMDLNRIHCTRSCTAHQKNLFTVNEIKKEIENSTGITTDKNKHKSNDYWVENEKQFTMLFTPPLSLPLTPRTLSSIRRNLCRRRYSWRLVICCAFRMSHKTNRTFILFSLDALKWTKFTVFECVLWIGFIILAFFFLGSQRQWLCIISTSFETLPKVYFL